MNGHLYRSRTNKMVAGVCGGIAEYFRIDPTIVRLIWVLFSLTYGIGVMVYNNGYCCSRGRRKLCISR